MGGTLKLLMRVVMALLLAVFLIGALLALRLSAGPVSLGPLVPYLADMLATGPLGVALDDAEIAWEGWGEDLDIRAKGVRLRDDRGQLLAAMPEVAVNLSGSAALRGVIALRRIEVLDAQIRLRRNADGAIEIGLWGGDETPIAPDGGAAVMATLMAALEGRAALPLLADLDRVSLVGAAAVLDDAALGLRWQLPELAAEFRRDAGDLRADLDVRLALGDWNGRAVVTARLDPARRRTEFDVRLDPLVPAALADVMTELAPLAAVDLPVAGRISGTLGPDLRPGPLRLDLSLAPGKLRLPAPIDTVYDVTGGRLLALVEGDSIAIEELRLQDGISRARLAGLLRDPFGALQLAIEAELDNAPLDRVARLWPAGMGRLARRWVLENLSEGRVSRATLRLGAARDGPQGAIRLDALDGELTLADISVRYMASMPVVRGVSGRARYSADRMEIEVTEGGAGGLSVDRARIDLTEIGTPDPWADIEVVVRGPVTDALAVIDRPPLEYARRLGIDPAEVSGDQATRLKLRVPLERDLKLKDIEVAAASTLRGVAMPVGPLASRLEDGALELQINRFGIEVNGSGVLAGVATDIAWVEDFRPEADIRSQYRLRGRLAAEALPQFGIALPVGMAVGPADTDVTVSRYADGRLRVDGRADLGETVLALPGGGWRKAAGQAAEARFVLTARQGGAGTIERLELQGPDLNAVLAGSWRSQGLGDRLDLVFETLQVAGSDISGTLAFGADGDVRADFYGRRFDATPFLSATAERGVLRRGQLRLRVDALILEQPTPLAEGVDLTVSLDPGRDPVVEMVARRLDARRYMSEATRTGDPGESSSMGAFDLSLRAETVRLDDQVDAQGVRATLRRDGLDWRNVLIDAKLAGEKGVFVEIKPDGDQRLVRLTSEDAGGMLRALGLYENMIGGSLSLDGRIDDRQPSEPFSGRVVVNDFRIVRAPIAARLLSAASLIGLVDVLGGNGLAFGVFQADIRLESRLLELVAMRANGASLGVTARGFVDLEAERLNLAGAIVPAYVLNSVLGKVPLVGQLLVGEQGGGVLAPTYEIVGDLAGPDVVVNPLSGLTPGILRNLFLPKTDLQRQRIENPEAFPEPRVILPEDDQRR